MTARRTVIFSLDDATGLPRLDELPGVSRVEAAPVRETTSTYFDTAGLGLTAAGIAIRRTTCEDEDAWHLELPADGELYEVRVPITGPARTVPKSLRTSVAATVHGERLSRAATVRTESGERRLLDGDGRVLVTVWDDRIVAEAPSAAGRSPRRESWRECRVTEGEDGSLLGSVVEALAAAGGRPAATASPVRKLLGDRVPTPAEVPRPRRKKATAEEVVQARITGQVRELRRLDPLVRHDTPDAVHQMRVAARRLRSALATFRPLLDRTVTDPVRDELKWLGTVLSDVRDAEVLHGRLDAMIAAEYPEAVRGGAQQRIERELEAQHAAARVRADAAMESPRYFALLARLDELAASPPWTTAAVGRARDVLPGAVRRDWKRLRRRVAVAERTSDRAERALRLHEARKAAKRARYAAETAAAVYKKEATGFVKGTKRLQTVLGEHHDSVVAQSWLRELADQATTEGDDSFTYGVLHAREDAAAETAQARMTKAWRRASRKKRLRWLS